MKKQLPILVAATIFPFTLFADNANPVGVYVSDKGETLTVSFHNQDHTVLVAFPGKEKVKLRRTVSGSGARYTSGNKEFWEHQGEATYSIADKIIFFGKEKPQN